MKKALYGFVETGVNAVEIFIRLHLLVFYSQIVGVPSFWAGIAISLSILWDAAIDPLVGRFSDSWYRRHGTRWHLVLLGAMATAILLTLLFHPPHNLVSKQDKWLYLLVMSLLFNTAYTFFSIPYSAMVGDFSDDRQVRGQVIAWRMMFANLGAFLGILIPGYYLSRHAADAYQQSSWGFAMIVLIATFLGSLSFTRKHFEDDFYLSDDGKEDFEPSVLEKLRGTFKNKPFLVLLGAFFLVNIGLTINSAMALFYYRMRLELGEDEIRNALILFLVMFSVGIPLWIWIGRKWGRKQALIAGALLVGVSFSVIYLLLPPNHIASIYLWGSIYSGLLVGAYALSEGILTDVVDYDTVKTREKNFGFYFGLWKFIAKLSRALALLLTGALLDWANVDFPDVDTPKRIALSFGPIVGLFFILAAVSLLPFGLTEERCLKIKNILSRRNLLSQTSAKRD